MAASCGGSSGGPSPSPAPVDRFEGTFPLMSRRLSRGDDSHFCFSLGVGDDHDRICQQPVGDEACLGVVEEPREGRKAQSATEPPLHHQLSSFACPGRRVVTVPRRGRSSAGGALTEVRSNWPSPYGRTSRCMPTWASPRRPTGMLTVHVPSLQGVRVVIHRMETTPEMILGRKLRRLGRFIKLKRLVVDRPTWPLHSGGADPSAMRTLLKQAFGRGRYLVSTPRIRGQRPRPHSGRAAEKNSRI